MASLWFPVFPNWAFNRNDAFNYTGRPEESPAESPETLVRPASAVWLPVTSVILPGLGQMLQGRLAAGASLGGAAFSGWLVYAGAAGNAEPEDPLEDLFFDRNAARRLFYGEALILSAGFVSAWDVFRASAPALQVKGRFEFLGPRETFFDLALAPFKPRHLTRPSTWLPLGALGAWIAYSVSDYRMEQRREDPLRRLFPYAPGDAFFTGALSMSAGVSEEAAFRGYVYPLFHQWFRQNWWLSNSAQAALFALAHRGTVDIPVVQGVIGLYLGWLTRRNGWQIGQAVCLHVWWDVIVVTAAMLTRYEGETPTLSLSVPVDL